ncbi:DUF892 family protein [Stenotrophomonas nitritireducens]|uniref:DUF892 family protein n=1 Tax=Stenotrophomonas nitritireducens TaxID=83617 RepID=UPI003D97607C
MFHDFAPVLVQCPFAIAWQLGHDEMLKLLLQTLEEERGIDQKLTRLAEGGGNPRAAAAEGKK